MAQSTVQFSGAHGDIVKLVAAARKIGGIRFKPTDGEAIRLSRAADDSEQPTRSRVAEILGTIGMSPSQS